MKRSGENVILRRIFHGVSCFPLHFMLYRGNLYYFYNSVYKYDSLTNVYPIIERIRIQQ